MLVLSRRRGQRVVIGQSIIVTVLQSSDGRVRLGFEAPQGTPIHREEVFDRIVRAESAGAEAKPCDESRFYAECG